MRVIQLMPTISFGDAVGNDARAIESVLREIGYETQIYAENIDARLPKGTALPVCELPPLAEEDVVLYHGSTGTELNFRLPELGGRKVMIYHNITPPEYFAPYSQAAAALTQSGLDGIRYLADKLTYCIADSDYNREDLLRMGYACPIDVCPVIVPFADYEKKPDPSVIARYRGDGVTNLLFVGRIAPNKKQEDVIAAFYHYHRHYNPNSRLFLVGSWNGMDTYHRQLLHYIEKLGLSDAVIFPGHIRFEEILAYYTLADVFVCMSEHEGFCVPLVEAMYFGVPIVARRAAAVPYTIGGKGLLLDDADPAYAAAVIHRAVTDKALREYVIRLQKRRLADFSYEHVRDRFCHIMQNILLCNESPKPRIFQLSTTLGKGDAMSNDILAFQEAFIHKGYPSQIFAEYPPRGKGWNDVQPFDKLPKLRKHDIAIYHHGTGTGLAEKFSKFSCKKVMVYHNVTPPAYFMPYDENAAKSCEWGLKNAKDMRPYVDYCIAVSDYNRKDLLHMGYSCPIDVCPILVPFSDYDQQPDKALLNRLQDGRTNVLFVGRGAPNKKIENVIRAFAAYKKSDPTARLLLVGAYDTEGAYYRELTGLIDQLGVSDVSFAGHITFQQILAYYHAASVFVCMSEHEGFCVPLLEAMYFDVPIVAYAAAAVPETMGNAGVLLRDNSPDAVAGAIKKLMEDCAYRQQIIEGQRERLAFFSYENVNKQLECVVQKIVEGSV